MANLKDLIVNGSARILGTLYADLSGNATTATTATKLGTSTVGNTITPIYLNGGTPAALGYTIAKSVPSDAKFTDTVYTHPTTSGNKHIPSGGSTGQILKYSADGTAVWANEYSYTHPTSSGNKHIPSGGSSGQFLKWSADGTAVWAADNNTTYTAGTGLSLSGTTINHAATITAGTVGTSAATSGSTLAVPYVTYNNTGHVTVVGTHTHTITGFLTSNSTLDATKLSGTIPSGCYTNTTYSAGTGLSLSGTTINHATSITAGTAGTTAATSGSVVSVPYVTYNASGHITAAGVRNHTVSTSATVKIDGITSGSSGINRYCACSTAAATAAKAANITAGTFTLEAGARVTVKFANANTAGTPTLNINSTGAKNIFLLGTQITTGSNKAVLKGMVDFVYDGTQWHVMSVTPATVAMMI